MKIMNQGYGQLKEARKKKRRKQNLLQNLQKVQDPARNLISAYGGLYWNLEVDYCKIIKSAVGI